MWNSRILLSLVGLIMASAAVAGPPARLTDLAWMEGVWSGNLGPQQLEERWNAPKAGSLAALVRLTNASGTAMIELIVVEEEADSLVLRLQQWDAGFKPRTTHPQTLRLKNISKRSVTFAASEDRELKAGLKELTYRQPAPGQFHITITPPEGDAFTVELQGSN